MSETVDPVLEFYNRHPFPQWDRIDWAPRRWWEINQMAGRSADATIPEDARILIAGCGTRTAIEWARSMPKAEIYAIDLSTSSIEVTRHLQAEFGQTNIVAEQRDLMTLGEDDGVFDVACATGVLHHLPDPVAGLRTVLGRLAPRGVLRMLAYGRRERYWIGELQDLVHALAAGGDLQRREVLGEALTRHGDFRQSRMEGIVASAQRNIDKNRPAWADAFVHPREVRYDIPALLEWLDVAGGQFLGWWHPAHWDIGWRLPEGPLRDAWDAMAMHERWHVADIVSAPNMNFWWGRADGPRPDLSWLDDDERVLDSVLAPVELRRATVDGGRLQPEVHKSTPLCVTALEQGDQVRIALTDGRGIDVHRYFGDLLRALDGRKTLRAAGSEVALSVGVDFSAVAESTLSVVRTLIHPHGILLAKPPG